VSALVDKLCVTRVSPFQAVFRARRLSGGWFG